MKRKRFSMIWLLPPVILAALFIWAAAGQTKSRSVQESFLAVSGETKEESRAETGTIRIETVQTMGTEAYAVSGESAVPEEAAGMSAAENTDPAEQMVTLLFAGDIYLSNHVLNAYDRAGGISGVLDEGLRAEIAGADLFIANQEFPFSDRGTPAPDKQFTFRLPTSRIRVLQEIGPDVVTLANNHTLDYGQEALLDTCMVLDEAGIVRIGAGSNLEEAKKAEILEVKGKKIGFLAASRVYPGASWAAAPGRPGMMSTYDPAMLLAEIRALRPLCDYLVVYVHWGIERNTTPEAYQKTMGRQYIDAGADLVVGSHPHVLQGIEYYKGKPILYSLGNFVFGSSIPETMLAKLTIGEAGIGLKLIPAVSSGGYTKQMDAGKQADFFSRMEGLSFGIRMEGDTVLEQDMQE